MECLLLGGFGPEIVLADYNLPTFSGPAALQLLKAAGQDMPFIMMSGAVSEETAVDSMRAGAQDYVSKQNLSRLVPAIDRELKEAAAGGKAGRRRWRCEASEARFHRLVEAMPVGLLICNAAGRIIYAQRGGGTAAAATPAGNWVRGRDRSCSCGDVRRWPARTCADRRAR